MIKAKQEAGLFDKEARLAKMIQINPSLNKLKLLINWEVFLPLLEGAFYKEQKGAGGRPRYDYLLLFKVLILQRYYHLSDDQMEFQLLGNLYFMYFLEIELSDEVPDSKTIWLFQDKLTKSGAIERLFLSFEARLKALGLIASEGKMVDATFVEVPKQRNQSADNKLIKEGKTPIDWVGTPHKLAQKDVDARWTEKNDVSY